MHGSQAEFYEGIQGFLGAYFLTLAVMNAVAALYLWQRLGRGRQALIWVIVAGLFVLMSALCFGGRPQLIGLPEWVREWVNRLSKAQYYTLGTTALLVILYIFREFFSRPDVGWTMLNASLALMGVSMVNEDFAKIVTKPDNVPIVAMVFLLGYFTWLATNRAVTNDRRIEAGEVPLEKLDDEKVLVWPDLVYTELICMVAVTALLIVWGIGLRAPLEEPASSVLTPNPSKAPWYFLGLQEMLVYFDPWMAGVVLPSLIVFGLMAIPYLDFNKEGNGYYTIKQRRFAYITFQLGFLELWVTLIILGTFLRGPNWNFFGPFEYWDAHKVEALNNVNLSEYFWIHLLDRDLPRASETAGGLQKFFMILLRELPGLLLVGGYLLILPLLLATTVFRKFYVRMGLIRYMVMANLLLFMALLPIKMILRWSFNLKYLIAIHEFRLNL